MKLKNLSKKEKREEQAMREYISPLQEMLSERRKDLKKEHDEDTLILHRASIVRGK